MAFLRPTGGALDQPPPISDDMTDDDTPPIEPTPGGVKPVVRRKRPSEAIAADTTSATEADSGSTRGGSGDAGSGDGGSGDGDAAGEGGDTPAAPDPTRRARLALAVVAVLALAAIGWAIFGRGDETAAPRPPTTTTTTTTTTIPVAKRPAEVTKVATVKAVKPTVAVLSSPPPEWDAATPVELWAADPLASSQESLPERPALPRLGYDIAGRFATPTGWEFSNPTSFGEPATFLVTETRGNWAKVMIPVRPNHTEGWVSLDDVDLSDTDYRVELHIGERHLLAYKGSEVIADTPVVVGKDATRTPTGRFYITDKVTKDDPSGFYGPFVLPLDAYSEQLDTFDEGVPVIAMHGTSRPDLLGQNASNGCIRIPNDVITTLHDQLPLGTQVEVYA